MPAPKLPLLNALLSVVLLHLASSTAQAQTTTDLLKSLDISGQVRTLISATASNDASPTALANQQIPGVISSTTQQGVAEAELHVSSKSISAIATVQGLLSQHGANGSSNAGDPATQASVWLNELVGNINAGAWQLSAGKKIVGWDVGYGFRPNDVVQQEKRRTLISTTAIGRPLAMAEYFDASNAVALVWVNPSHSATSDTVQEQAFAARVYRREGNLDWHGFARYGQVTGSSVGAAAAWVASDALELHASARIMQHAPGLTSTAAPGALLRSSPWQAQLQDQRSQVLIGANFTTESQHSFFLEAWWDGTALADSQWQAWRQRNLQLHNSAAMLPQYQREIGYNLAWQNQALSASANLRRKNLFARWSWQTGPWETACDLLWTPEDRGHVATVAFAWQGDRTRIDSGIRFYGGPTSAVLAQLPDARTAYVSATWEF
ncbi:MAG: hypothetical protein KGM99_07060 [Burkholderiales bacterium]|nr:hypothetical protein [Burkholderiales bacterium]